MRERLSTETINMIIIIGVLLLVLEVSFFSNGFIFSALFSGFFIYIGWKKFNQLWGKVFFWIGIISLVISILNMMAIRFVIVVCLILAIVHYSRSQQKDKYIKPTVYIQEDEHVEPLIEIKPIFSQKMFGDQKTANTAYQWTDINIHGGFGNRTIDLTNTVLPNDTAVISIRHVFGNIEVLVPYEVEVSIYHSSMFGKATIFGNYYPNLFNKTLSYQTPNYSSKQPRVKIITSLFSGDIEVKRI